MIYFVMLGNPGPIKIGFSRSVDFRLRTLAKHYGTDLELLKTKPGRMPQERKWHGRFKHLQFGKTEQFRPAPDLLAAIGLPPLEGVDIDSIKPIVPRKDRSVPDGLSVKLDRRLVGMAKLLAKYRGVDYVELINELLDRPISQEFLELVNETGLSGKSE